MKVTFVEPYAEVRGVLAYKGEYYVRMLNGKPVLQRRPKRNGHIASAREKANQQRFTACFAGRKWRDVKSGNRMVTEWSPINPADTTAKKEDTSDTK